MYLLDTNVISELRKVKSGRVDPGFALWAQTTDAQQNFISVISILEIEVGAGLLERRDPAQGTRLRTWIRRVVSSEFQGRILPFDLRMAQRCASLHIPDPKSELDAMIAATALVHGLTVVTRNTADFAGTGVRLLNPWEA